MLLKGLKKSVLSFAAAIGLACGVVVSVSTFVADRFAAVAERSLDDPQTEEKDMLDLTEVSLPAYDKGIHALEQASKFAPLNADYVQSLADLHFRVDVWRQTMVACDTTVYGDLPAAYQPWHSSFLYAGRTVRLDPANPDHFLVRGRLFAAAGDREEALVQLMKAMASYPVNASIRYDAAMQMLMMGMYDKAGEQARLLAMSDDSYRLDDDDPASELVRERRLPIYQETLGQSYLYKALEIIWRTSGKDVSAVNLIVPKNVDAQETARMFLEQKGVGDSVSKSPP